MNKYEYKIFKDHQNEIQLNALGQEGWMLMNYTFDKFVGYELIFMRLIESP